MTSATATPSSVARRDDLNIESQLPIDRSHGVLPESRPYDSHLHKLYPSASAVRKRAGSTDALSADALTDAGGGRFTFPTRGTQFVFSDFPPGGGSTMHATDTIDYLVVLSGEVQPCRIVNVLCPAHPVGKGATVSGKLDH